MKVARICVKLFSKCEFFRYKRYEQTKGEEVRRQLLLCKDTLLQNCDLYFQLHGAPVDKLVEHNNRNDLTGTTTGLGLSPRWDLVV